MHTPIVGIIVPCYNEQEMLPVSHQKLTNYLSGLKDKHKISHMSFIAYIDDRSIDYTWETIKQLKENETGIKGLRLSKNCGHQYAVLAGLMTFKQEADCIISIDADLQDDIQVIEQMIEEYLKGNEIVYGVRKKRDKDSYMKRFTALGFYKLMHSMGVDIIYNHADFRLTSQRVLNELEQFEETNLFLRGIFPLLGFKHTIVNYNRLERTEGESKYPVYKMLSLAWTGITSFSIKPLRIITVLGASIFILCLFFMVYAIYSYFFIGTVRGWLSTVLPFYFLGGIQLLAIGILGEYLGKIYKEVKKRPRFIIDEKI